MAARALALAWALAGLLLMLAAAPARGEPLAIGKGNFQFPFPDARGGPERSVTVWYYRPAAQDAHAKVVFVMPGTHRNGAAYRDRWAAHAQRHGFLLLAPEFSRQSFPVADYQFGGVKGPDAGAWTFPVIERLFDHARSRASLATACYYLYGHSAGAQFVHRYLIFMPRLRLALAIAANAGAYTLPVHPSGNQPGFPWTLDPSWMDERRLEAVFSRRLAILLGERDADPAHPQLPRSPAARAQGENRLERGRYFFQAARDQASRQGAAFHWTLATVPGVGHSDAGMARAAVRLIAEDAGPPACQPPVAG